MSPIQILGKVACRVLSALLGIGVAERSWGAVKQLKSGNRSHLGAEATRMQATIFGAACIDRARILRVEKELTKELWNDDDVEFQLGLENFAADETNEGPMGVTPVRRFHAWREDWETVSAMTNDIVHETRLIHKYGKLRWLDPDTDLMYVAENDNMEWRRCLGWCVIGLCESGEMEAWPVKLLPSLIRKTPQAPNLNVEFVYLTPEEKVLRKAARQAARDAKDALHNRSGRPKAKRKRPDSDTDSDVSDDER